MEYERYHTQFHYKTVTAERTLTNLSYKIDITISTKSVNQSTFSLDNILFEYRNLNILYLLLYLNILCIFNEICRENIHYI